jgi:hypothetical protein
MKTAKLHWSQGFLFGGPPSVSASVEFYSVPIGIIVIALTPLTRISQEMVSFEEALSL